MGGWIIDQVFSRELIEAVIKLELWEHEQTLSDSVLFHLLSLTELPTSYVGRHHGGSWHVSPLLLSKQRQVVCDEAVQWERVDGNFGLRKHVEHIELIGHGALLTNGKHLEPAQALSLLDDCDEVVPFFAGQRFFNIDLKALEVGLMLGLALLLLHLVFDGGALWLMLSDEFSLGSGLEPLPQ